MKIRLLQSEHIHSPGSARSSHWMQCTLIIGGMEDSMIDPCDYFSRVHISDGLSRRYHVTTDAMELGRIPMDVLVPLLRCTLHADNLPAQYQYHTRKYGDEK